MNNMTMSYELITPERASEILGSNNVNRKISKGTVSAYATDMRNGHWDENVGVAISIDSNGVLRDGQHRLFAIISSGVPIHMWVCRGVDANGQYDNNRKRSNSDQIAITRPDLNAVYKSTRTISIIRNLINTSNGNRCSRVTPNTLIDYIDRNKKMLDGFFMNIPQNTVSKISTANVLTGLYLAYANGVEIEIIKDFYEVLTTGMSTSEKEFPIISFRNYLLNTPISCGCNIEVIKRCQYALKKYITGSCTKKTMVVNDLFWPFL